MKNSFSSMLGIGIISILVIFTINNHSTVDAIPNSEFEDQVFPWLIETKLTKYTDIDDFRPADSITRAEASKFIVSYAKLIGLEKRGDDCSFSDTIGFDDSLEGFIGEACAYGLFRGDNGKFMPRNSLTEAQAIVVILRGTYGAQDENINPWYSNYYDLAIKDNIIDDELLESLDKKNITREKLTTWLYRVYNSFYNNPDSGAPEDTIVYETDVDGPSDCSSYEKYDSARKVCSYECLDEAECKTIQDQIDAELNGWSESLDGGNRDAPKSKDSPSSGVQALYTVGINENIELKSGANTPEYQNLWKEVADLSPDTLSRDYIESFEVYSDSKSDVIAFVSDDDGNGKWKVSINLPIHSSSDIKGQKATIIHELSHIITLNKDQFTTPSGVCPSYETDEGCTKQS